MLKKKQLFLDVDGVILTENGQQSYLKEVSRVNSTCKTTEEALKEIKVSWSIEALKMLKHIIDKCHNSENIEIIITSTWQTDHFRYQLLYQILYELGFHYIYKIVDLIANSEIKKIIFKCQLLVIEQKVLKK